MELFSLIFTSLIPVYFSILLGYLAGKYLKIDNATLGSLLINILTPVIIFGAVYSNDFDSKLYFVALALFGLTSVVALIVRSLAKSFFTDKSDILTTAYNAGSANYALGFPISLLLLGETGVDVYTIFWLGMVLFIIFTGSYIFNTANYSPKKSFAKVLKTPMFYGLVLGLLFKLLSIDITGDTFDRTLSSFQGSLSLVTLLLVGSSLNTEFKFNKEFVKYININVLLKFVLWPFLAFVFIFVDKSYLNILDTEVHKVLVILAAMPFASLTVAFANDLKLDARKPSVTLILGNLLGLILIPVIIYLGFSII